MITIRGSHKGDYMSGSIIRVNSRSYEVTGNHSLPADRNRSYFFIVCTVGSGTIEFGKGGGKIPLKEGAHYNPPIVPTSEIDIESTTGTFVIHEG